MHYKILYSVDPISPRVLITSLEIFDVQIGMAEICFKISFDCILNLVLWPKHGFRFHVHFIVVKVVSKISGNKQ